MSLVIAELRRTGTKTVNRQSLSVESGIALER